MPYRVLLISIFLLVAAADWSRDDLRELFGDKYNELDSIPDEDQIDHDEDDGIDEDQCMLFTYSKNTLKRNIFTSTYFYESKTIGKSKNPFPSNNSSLVYTTLLQNNMVKSIHKRLTLNCVIMFC